MALIDISKISRNGSVVKAVYDPKKDSSKIIKPMTDDEISVYISCVDIDDAIHKRADGVKLRLERNFHSIQDRYDDPMSDVAEDYNATYIAEALATHSYFVGKLDEVRDVVMEALLSDTCDFGDLRSDEQEGFVDDLLAGDIIYEIQDLYSENNRQLDVDNIFGSSRLVVSYSADKPNVPSLCKASLNRFDYDTVRKLNNILIFMYELINISESAERKGALSELREMGVEKVLSEINDRYLDFDSPDYDSDIEDVFLQENLVVDPEISAMFGKFFSRSDEEISSIFSRIREHYKSLLGKDEFSKILNKASSVFYPGAGETIIEVNSKLKFDYRASVLNQECNSIPPGVDVIHNFAPLYNLFSSFYGNDEGNYSITVDGEDGRFLFENPVFSFTYAISTSIKSYGVDDSGDGYFMDVTFGLFNEE